MTVDQSANAQDNRKPKKWRKFLLILGIAVAACFCLPILYFVSDLMIREAGFLPTWTPSPTDTPTLTPAVTPSSTPVPTETPTPRSTKTAAPTQVPTVDVSACRLNAVFVEDVTVPDNMRVGLGESLVKTWKVRNSGTCAWGPGYQLRFESGERLGASQGVDLPQTEPGEEAEISVNLTTPEGPGTYRGEWRLCVNQDSCFGSSLYVQINAVPPATSTPTPTSAPTPTPLPDNAGITEWLVYGGTMVGVREMVWSYRIDYYRPESGKVFVSLYILAMNIGDSEESFYSGDFALVDGGGEIHGELFLPEREPSFGSCAIKPGGVCEGWWTTSIWDRDEVKEKLLFRWDPALFASIQETPIDQD